jgi:vacuolar-type H+-ATPase subunit H
MEEFCDPEKVNTSIMVFEGLKYFKEIRKARFSYRNYIYNAAFDDSLKEIMKNVFSAVRMKRTNKPVKVNKFEAFGMECREMLTDAVKTWYSDKEVSEIKERAKNLVLDREAVSGAQSALKDVTEMMRTEGEETVQAKVEKPETMAPKVSNSWEGLASALDDVQKEYLRAAMAGKAKDYLREHNLNLSRVEDAINGIAMDTINDNIVEDGTVFDVYVSELESVL